MFLLAHLSDPHLAGWSVDRPWSLFGKRVTGYLSWRLKRANIHRAPVLERLVADIKAAKPDHVAITGDLTNISLPQEFAAAAAWLQEFGTAENVSVIPGNHDAYIALPFEQSLGLWRANMAGLVPGGDGSLGAAERPVAAVDDFPYVRQRGPVALIGASTAIPTRPFSAVGELGQAQLDKLSGILEKLGQAGLFRVLMIHHPPYTDPGGARKSLRDRKALRQVLEQKGVELVLHGHTHIACLGKVATPAGEAPVIGVPSASAIKYGHKDASAYHLYRISKASGRWQVDVSVRGWDAGQERFIPTGEMSLTVSPQAC